MNEQPNIALHLRDGETLHVFVRRGIEVVFNTLAEEVAGLQMTEGMAASVPMNLFFAETGLLETWDRMHLAGTEDLASAPSCDTMAPLR